MQEGDSYEIEIIGNDGKPWTVWLGKTDVHNKGLPIGRSTDDPEWEYRNQQTGETGRNHWIWYVTYNGDISHSKVHCEYNVAPPGPSPGEYIGCWFEHRNARDEEDENSANRHKMLFRGPDGHNWEAVIQNVSPPFPAQPYFVLRRV